MKARGFALILVVWVLVLLSILAVNFSSMIRLETQAADWTSAQTRVDAAILAGIHRALLGVTALNAEQRWTADGRTRQFAWLDSTLEIVLRSASARVDLNYAPREVLAGLFENQLHTNDGLRLADRLIDWRDRDSEPSPLGAEAPAYHAAGLKQRPSDAPLRSIDELSQVLGFDPDMVEKLRPHVTVHARRAKVDAGSASIEVLSALPGVSRSLAQTFIDQRTAAHAEGRPLDLRLLDGVRGYLLHAAGSSLLQVELVLHTDSQQHAEQVLIRLKSDARDYEIIAREPLARHTTESEL